MFLSSVFVSEKINILISNFVIMTQAIKIIDFIHSIISTINRNVEEHKNIERSKFWKNFKVWNTLIYESLNGWFFEWVFMWHVATKEQGIYNYHYRILNNRSWALELCPIYNVAGFMDTSK